MPLFLMESALKALVSSKKAPAVWHTYEGLIICEWNSFVIIWMLLKPIPSK